MKTIGKFIHKLIWQLLACLCIYVIICNLSFTITFNSDKGISLWLKNISYGVKYLGGLVK